MNPKIAYFISGIVLAAILGGALYLASVNKSNQENSAVVQPAATSTNPVTVPPKTPVQPTSGHEYKNNQYGFTFTLPESWKGYTVISDEWKGYSLTETSPSGQVITEKGPLISIRHPDWEYKAPRQDIPLMIFTLKQWNDMQAEKFHIGAAPINPSEIGRNSKYVFAIPARYNYAFLTGYEEVDQIIRGDNLRPF